MIGRLKFDIDALVNEILDQVPQDLLIHGRVLDPAMGGGQFVKEVERRKRAAGLSDREIADSVFGCESSKLRVNYAVNKHKLVGTYTTGDALNKKFDMKFDLVVGNPPFQDKTGNENSTNSADLYTRFVQKSFELSNGHVAMVIPSAWSGPKRSILKELLFEQHQPLIFNTHGKKWFPVEMNTCYFVTTLERKGPTVLTDANGACLTMTLDRDSCIPMDLSTFALREKISQACAQGNMAHRWLRGHLNLNEIVAVSSGVEFVCAVGKRNQGLETQIIDPVQETTGLGLHKLVIPNLGSTNDIGNIKTARTDQVGGHSVVFITADSAEQLSNIQSYLESGLIRFVIAATKISTPNSKQLFARIPDLDWNRTWSDQDLYKHFGLTQAEIDIVERYSFHE